MDGREGCERPSKSKRHNRGATYRCCSERTVNVGFVETGPAISEVIPRWLARPARFSLTNNYYSFARMRLEQTSLIKPLTASEPARHASDTVWRQRAALPDTAAHCVLSRGNRFVLFNGSVVFEVEGLDVAEAWAKSDSGSRPTALPCSTMFLR
jgi:hypothetical protein